VIVNGVSGNTLLMFPALSVTEMVQVVYIHHPNVFKVIVLFHDVAIVVELLQAHPYVMVHASSVVKV
jgi:hypothetical protein